MLLCCPNSSSAGAGPESTKGSGGSSCFGHEHGKAKGPVIVFAKGHPINTERGIQQLSAIDHSAILTCINPKAFWFPSPGLSAVPLKAALEQVLADYPLLASRLGTDGGPAGLGPLRKRLACRISICNAGAEFVEVPDPQRRSMADFPLGAMSRAGFTHMSQQPLLPDFFSSVDIGGLLSGREPLLKVRLTQLTCGGSILALTLAHAVLDGHSAAMFLNDWAAAYRKQLASPPAAAAPGRGPEPPAAAEGSTGRSLSGRVPPVPAPGGGGALPTPPAPPSSPASPGGSAASAGRAPAAGAPEQECAPTAPPPAPEALAGAAAPEAAGARACHAARARPIMDRGVLLLEQQVGGKAERGKARSSGAPPAPIHLLASSAGGAAGATPAPLRCLALQRVPAPGWLPALGQLGTLVKMVREQERIWPGFRDDLCTMVLHLPPNQVAQLKAAAAGGNPTVSTNDAVAGLVWTLMCELRGRPLPGQAPGGSPNCMGLAVDLRRNCGQGQVPLNLFANATWCLHVPAAGREALAAGDGAGEGGVGGEGEVLAALRQGAAKVRSSLAEFRSGNPHSGRQVVELAAQQCQAPFSAQLHLACNVMTGQDAMLSSWQFPYWQADFGAGGPLRYMGALHPTPPWSAAVMGAHPSHGGLYLFLVVPSSARATVRRSKALAALVPGARFA